MCLKGRCLLSHNPKSRAPDCAIFTTLWQKQPLTPASPPKRTPFYVWFMFIHKYFRKCGSHEKDTLPLYQTVITSLLHGEWIAFKEVRGDGSMPIPTVAHPLTKLFLKIPLSFSLRGRWTPCLWPQKYQTDTMPCVISTADCILHLCPCFPKIKLHTRPWTNFPSSHVSSFCHLYHHLGVFFHRSSCPRHIIYLYTDRLSWR